MPAFCLLGGFYFLSFFLYFFYFFVVVEGQGRGNEGISFFFFSEGCVVFRRLLFSITIFTCVHQDARQSRFQRSRSPNPRKGSPQGERDLFKNYLVRAMKI